MGFGILGFGGYGKARRAVGASLLAIWVERMTPLAVTQREIFNR